MLYFLSNDKIDFQITAFGHDHKVLYQFLKYFLF